MVTKMKVRPAQACDRVITAGDGEVVCPPPANNRSKAAMKKKRQSLVK